MEEAERARLGIVPAATDIFLRTLPPLTFSVVFQDLTCFTAKEIR